MSSDSEKNVYHEIHDTLQIAKHVVKKCDLPPDSDSTISDSKCLVPKIFHYTGINILSIEQLVITKEKKTFHDWLKYKKDKNKTSQISFERMRDVIIDEYVNKLQVPTKNSILNALGVIENKKLYTLSMLELDLNILGFVWKRLPKSDKYIIVEDRKKVSKRMKYLHQMREYRNNNRVLIHIERTVPYYPNERVNSTEIIVIASPQLGFIDVYFPPKLQPLVFRLAGKLHVIPQNSVFVIEQSNPSAVDFERTCKMPTMHSKKAEMIAWLESHNIPCESTMHRGELFALIEKHKVHFPHLDKICQILKAAGHDVLLRPPELSYIGYFSGIMGAIFANRNMTRTVFKTCVIENMNEASPEFWMEEDQKMAAKEQKIYDEELKLELVLDKLMEAVQSKSLDAADLEVCYDGEMDGEFLDEVMFDATTKLPMVRKPESPLLSESPVEALDSGSS